MKLTYALIRLFTLASILTIKAQVTPAERQALQDLYNATNGPGWATENDGFIGDEWDFNGVVNNNWYGVTVANGHVTELDLEFNELVGTIPSSIGNLVHLTLLNLSTNNLSGSIPSEIGNLVLLNTLDLFNNGLTGDLPPSLGNLSELQQLFLGSNDLNGSIPSELGNLTGLSKLYLSSNSLSGPIPPEFGNLSNLEYLDLKINQLNGSIPPELGNLSNLKGLYLFSNQLSGTIPPELGNLSQLNDLRLSGNDLSGSIPPELGDLVSLSVLYLNNNELNGTIPLQLGNLANLSWLELGGNKLTGAIPAELGNLTNLNYLSLTGNLLTGTIPKELADTALFWLALSSNALSGAIPPELGNLSNLNYLYLYSNQLSGPIPPELGNLGALKTLSLSGNLLNGTIPPVLGNLSNLESLDAQANQLSGSIPPELGNLSNLEYLSLGINDLSGTVPKELGALLNLVQLSLSDNHLTGTIPPELGNLTNLTHIYLYSNQLSGTIPVGLGNLSSIKTLVLKNNNLSGDIPFTIVDQTLVSFFYVEENRFDFGNLEYTYLNDDNISLFTYSPQQKTDQPEVYQLQVGDNINLSTAISGTQNHYQWYKDGQPINAAPDAPDYNITDLTLQDAGTYHCVMTSDIVAGLVLTRHNIVLTVEVGTPGDQVEENWNTITVWKYDLNNNLKGNSRSYYNDLGKQVQTQGWDAQTEAIWGQATLYDYQGRGALATLSAPIIGQDKFLYHETFITNEGGTAYDAPDFDIDPFNPDDVYGDGPLGQYYTGITSDQYQDITVHPYSRTVFSDLNPGTARAMVGGNKVDTDGDEKITENDLWPQAYSFIMPASNELSLNVAFGDDKYKTIQTLKTVVRDVHGNENVVFKDTDGKLLATARSGAGLSQQMILRIGEQGYVDVHIPQGVVSGISITDENAVTLYNLITDAVEPTQPKNLLPGFYRVAVKDMDLYVPNSIAVAYRVNYYDYSLNEYDEAGRMVASYQPVVDQNGDKLVTTYRYNTLGQLVVVSSPDEGSARFKYRNDGQIRYSQNSVQAKADLASYTDYDSFGRPVESGVLQDVVFSNLDPDAPLPQVTKKEVVRTTYDFLTPEDNIFLGNLDPGYQHPSFLAGNVVKTANDQATTYYSYDGYGRVKWMVQYMEGLGTKTLDYGYEPLTGLVQRVTYQKGQDNQFIHRYAYNRRDQLIKVETSVDDNAYTLQAEYIYNDAGTLVRTEMADGAQGVDYVYNLAGQLKSINHPALGPVEDPGGDANDLFGMQLDYHFGDYQRTENNNITTAPEGQDQYNGNLKGVRWQTSINQQQISQYVYSYDRNNWLIEANFDDGLAAGTAYDVGPITYDANGNIQGLVRNKNLHLGSTAMDDLTYHYDPKKPNRLLWVDDSVGDAPDADDLGGQVQNNYQYNGIGQLTYDLSQDVAYIYNASGLVTEVLQKGSTLVKFFYNDRNHRVRKESYVGGDLKQTTYYVRDVAGQVMAVYSDGGGEMALAEQPIYGMGRLGVAYNGMNDAKIYVYELTDHLGNVRAVFTKNGADDHQVEGYTDYYPFGMPMPGRTLSGAEGYRYAFQGQEKDPETGKEAFELRLWDSRIGRWWSPDPAGQYSSPYLGMGNNPIGLIDPDGAKALDDYKLIDGVVTFWRENKGPDRLYNADGTQVLGTANYGVLSQLDGVNIMDKSFNYLSFSNRGDFNSFLDFTGDLSKSFKAESGGLFLSKDGNSITNTDQLNTDTFDFVMAGFGWAGEGEMGYKNTQFLSGIEGAYDYKTQNYIIKDQTYKVAAIYHTHDGRVIPSGGLYQGNRFAPWSDVGASYSHKLPGVIQGNRGIRSVYDTNGKGYYTVDGVRIKF
ncbi:leucine-rich repeat domain-containing protein [Flagellimonas beolgyonensis]|uniref:leucine-rich repeat domain-containing protein n=1 Tax=Flagellimonas beolgyonensis TaxID=864064 RepID=UPI003D654D47